MYYVLTGLTGFLLGMAVAGFLGMLHKGQQKHDLNLTWKEGYEAGKRVSRGKELLNMVPSRGVE